MSPETPGRLRVARKEAAVPLGRIVLLFRRAAASPRGRVGADVLRASIAAGSLGKASRLSPREIPSEPLHLGHLQNAVPYLFREHQLRIGGDADQHLVELQVATLAGLQNAAFAQQVDEILEQRAIEELR